MAITIDQLPDEIEKVLGEVIRVANSANEATLDVISKEAVKVARDNAPNRTKAYRKTITRKKTKDEDGTAAYVVYASGSGGSLSHLLENGHASRKGDFVPGKPHFSLAQKKADQEIEKEFQRQLESKK